MQPAYPGKQALIEFAVDTAGGFRFFIDPASLSVGSDGEVRYVLVARSAEGAENVSFEGMRCNSAELRLYALGRGGAWTGLAGEWRSMRERSVQRWHATLFREFFCPQKDPIASVREGIQALREGGHPAVKGLTGDIPRGF
ncbi:MAG: CNP1-like family protein [Panacagrimonas sp.]